MSSCNLATLFSEICSGLKENEEKLKTQVTELSMRERVLMRRLAAKEQDMQEYAVSTSVYGLLARLKSFHFRNQHAFK